MKSELVFPKCMIWESTISLYVRRLSSSSQERWMGGGKGEGGRPSLNRSLSSSSQETYDETSHDRNELSMSREVDE
jgi:hypothetical protein